MPRGHAPKKIKLTEEQRAAQSKLEEERSRVYWEKARRAAAIRDQHYAALQALLVSLCATEIGIDNVGVQDDSRDFRGERPVVRFDYGGVTYEIRAVNKFGHRGAFRDTEEDYMHLLS